MGIFGSFLDSFAGYLENIYFDSYGLASKIAAYEPEVTDDVREYKATHVSKLEKLYNKFVG